MTVFDSGCPTKRPSKDAVEANGRSRHSRDSFHWKNIWETRVRTATVACNSHRTASHSAEESRMREPTMLHRLAAEFFGTFWLVFGGCGSAVFAAKFTSDGTSLGIGFPWRRTRFRADGAHRRVRVRHHLWRPLQSRGHAGRGAGQAGGVEGVARLLDHPGD